MKHINKAQSKKNHFNLLELFIRSCTGLFFSASMLGIIIFLPVWWFTLFLILIALIITFVELPNFTPPTTPTYYILLIFYILLPLFFMNKLAYSNKNCLILILLIAFINDTAAYCVGSVFGNHLIAPSISPKKTWEGFFSGLMGVCALMSVLFYGMYSHLQLCAFATITAALAALGDFFESWLKRKAHLKDASCLLPGHGGLLDRFDSIIALIFAWGLLNELGIL